MAAITTGVVVAAGGAAIQKRAADKAARAQTNASRESIAAQQSSEERALALQRPFFNAGYAANAALLDLTGIDRSKLGGDAAPGSPEDLSSYAKYDFKTDPGYDFRMGEGIKALDRSAAARGVLNSGGQGRKLVRYGQDYASNEYQNVYNRIAQIAGFGGQSAAQSSNVVFNTGQGVGGALVNAGEARASGFAASGNALANALGQGAKAFGFFRQFSDGSLQPPITLSSNASNVFNRSIAMSNAFG